MADSLFDDAVRASPSSTTFRNIADAPCGDILGPLRRAKWNLAVATELAEPAHMELVPIWGPQAELVDFEWCQATPSATLVLGCPGADMKGQTLMQFFAGDFQGYALFKLFQRTVRSGVPQIARLAIGDWSGIQQVLRSADGVAVVLTSASAVVRVVAARRRVQALEECSTPAPNGPSVYQKDRREFRRSFSFMR